MSLRHCTSVGRILPTAGILRRTPIISGHVSNRQWRLAVLQLLHAVSDVTAKALLILRPLSPSLFLPLPPPLSPTDLPSLSQVMPEGAAVVDALSVITEPNGTVYEGAVLEAGEFDKEEYVITAAGDGEDVQFTAVADADGNLHLEG